MAPYLYPGNESNKDILCQTILYLSNLDRGNLLSWEQYTDFVFISRQTVEYLNNCLTKIGNTRKQSLRRLGIRPKVNMQLFQGSERVYNASCMSFYILMPPCWVRFYKSTSKQVSSEIMCSAIHLVSDEIIMLVMEFFVDVFQY